MALLTAKQVFTQDRTTVFSELGEAAVYLPALGMACSINVIINHAGQSVPVAFGNYAINAPDIVININAADIAPTIAAQGDQIVVDDVVYRITDVDKDGYQYNCTVIVDDG